MDVRIVGGDCADCHRLSALTQAAMKDLGLGEAKRTTIHERGATCVPALVVNGRTRLVGGRSSETDILRLLTLVSLAEDVQANHATTLQ